MEKITRTMATRMAMVLLSVSMVWVNNASRAQTSDLPELGDSATQHLTPIQETYIGKDFFRKLVISPDFVDDYELRDYLQNLGDQVGQNADLRGTVLHFNLLKDNNLNAFAVPGGYITFHTGLLMATETESELASVIGHEISHLTQRHLPRLLARADANRIPAIAAIIGSILIGGQAGIAGITATNAAVMSDQLSYSRDFEREADAIGIRLLAAADFDPAAMAQFFGKLERYTRHDNADIPEFLKTHPLSYARVADSQDRASEYPHKVHISSFEYYLAQARIRALLVERQDDPLLFFRDQSKSGDPLLRDAATYGKAVTLLDLHEPEEAILVSRPLAEKYPDHPWIQVLQGEIELDLDMYEESIGRYQGLLEKHPQKLYISYQLAEAYLASGQPELARKTLRYQIRRHPDNYILYQLLSKTNAEMKNYAEAHQAKAEYFARLGAYKRALTSLRLALNQAEENSYLSQSIEARIIEFEEKQRLWKGISKI
jgi:predicted Zn-dependent protease